MDLGRVLQSFRHAKHFSQNKAAELLEVSQSTYCDWESNTTFPNAENLVKIADLFEVDVKELLPSLPLGIAENAKKTSNTPASKIELADALLKLAESINSLVTLLKYMMQEDNKEK